MAYLIKSDALGFSRVEASHMSKERKADYIMDGYREVGELEFTLAGMVSRFNAKRIIRIALELASEMGDELDEPTLEEMASRTGV